MTCIHFGNSVDAWLYVCIFHAIILKLKENSIECKVPQICPHETHLMHS